MLPLLVRTISSARRDWVNEIGWTWLISTASSLFFCLFAYLRFLFLFPWVILVFPRWLIEGFRCLNSFIISIRFINLFHRDRIIVNTEGCKENAGLLFHITAFVIRGFLQTLLHIQRWRMAVRLLSG